jgi:hypothetical protein
LDLIVTIDTEADDQWDHGVPLVTGNVAFWPPFIDLCTRYGVKPTFLVTSEILGNDAAVEALASWSRDGLAEIGSHLHPWSTPPYRDVPGLRENDSLHAFPSELSEELLRAKLTVLTNQVAERIGVPPTSFRAGRFGMNAACAQMLAQSGYIADTSVTPHFSWRHAQGTPGGVGGPDFVGFPLRPFFVSGTGDPGLLELPVTIMRLKDVRVASGVPAVLGPRAVKVERAFRQRGKAIPDPLWMRPYPGVTSGDLERMWDAAEAQGLPLVVLIFHSSELKPGASPYRRTRRSVAALLVMLDELFRYVASRGGMFPSVSEAARRLLGAELPSLPL